MFANYIVQGLRDGFCIGFDYSHTCKKSRRNMDSVWKKPEVVRDYLAKECAEGRVLGPLDPDLSSFGVIPKGTTGKWRLIMDLLAPEGKSVNDGIQGAMHIVVCVS